MPRGGPLLRLGALALLWGSNFLLIKVGLRGFSPYALVAATVLGLFGTGAMYVLFYRVIAELGSTAASSVTYLLPVVALGLGVVVLRERVTLLAGLGVTLVLAGLVLVRPAARDRP